MVNPVILYQTAIISIITYKIISLITDGSLAFLPRMRVCAVQEAVLAVNNLSANEIKVVKACQSIFDSHLLKSIVYSCTEIINITCKNLCGCGYHGSQLCY